MHVARRSTEPVRKRPKLLLPAPQVSDSELETVRAAHAQHLIRKSCLKCRHDVHNYSDCQGWAELKGCHGTDGCVPTMAVQLCGRAADSLPLQILTG